MLTEPKIRNARPREKPYKLTDGGGLYLCHPDHAQAWGKWWRLDYRLIRRPAKDPVPWHLPDTSLKAARAKRDEARKLPAAGTDPGEV